MPWPFRKRSLRPYPPAVAAAFDYFIWAALDDLKFVPTESRRFTDDERRYNRILNEYFFPKDLKSGRLQDTEEWPFPQMRTKDAPYSPCYFPDGLGGGSASVLKDAYLASYMQFRIDRLMRAAEFGKPGPVGDLPLNPVCFVRPDGFSGYYRSLLAAGRRFADATVEERESVALESIRNALATSPGAAAGDGWYTVDRVIAEAVLFEIFDLEQTGPG